MELPPRARRILAEDCFRKFAEGTTSACAENTKLINIGSLDHGNYLRVRGEYFVGGFDVFEQAELPPRARRILDVFTFAHGVIGTTSACAENTILLLSLVRLPWNYLRVRGEYARSLSSYWASRELPPRARRIPAHPYPANLKNGTTSACAENTNREPT